MSFKNTLCAIIVLLMASAFNIKTSFAEEIENGEFVANSSASEQWEVFGGGAPGCIRSSLTAAAWDGQNKVFIASDAIDISCVNMTSAKVWMLDIKTNEMTPIFFDIEAAIREAERISAMVIYDGELIIGGTFETINGTLVNNIARWTGDQWLPLAEDGIPGVERDPDTTVGRIGVEVETMKVHDGLLYVGGQFASAGGVSAYGLAVWNGAEWTSLGEGFKTGFGLGGTVRAIEWFNGSLYAAGAFSLADGSQANSIARWTGAEWKAVGLPGQENGVSGFVYTLKTYNSRLFVGGQFDFAGTVAANNLAQWTGSGWGAVSESGDFGINGTDGRVLSLETFQGDLIIGGRFEKAGTKDASGIATWDASSFAQLGGGLFRDTFFSSNPFAVGVPEVLLTINDRLLVVGEFLRADGRNGILSTGVDLDSGIEAKNRAFKVSWFDGNNWDTAIGTGISKGLGTSSFGFGNPAPQDIMTERGTTYVAGCFDQIGAKRIQHVAAFSGESWNGFHFGEGTYNESIKQQLNAACATAILPGEDIYVGLSGKFIAQGQLFRGAAKWNGDVWKPLGEGEENGLVRFRQVGKTRLEVNKIVEYKGDIFYAGQFAKAGTKNANNIARWDGSAWQPLGSPDNPGVNGKIRDMIIYDGRIVVAGNFSMAGDLEVPSGLAAWDGNQWDRFSNQPLDGRKYVLAVDTGRLYVGGSRLALEDAGDFENVVYWDNTGWHRLGMNSAESGNQFRGIDDLEVFGKELYLSGRVGREPEFGETPIIRWTSTGWAPLDSDVAVEVFDDGSFSGRNARVTAMDLSQAGLTLGGFFFKAGGEISANIARFIPQREILLSTSVERASNRSAQPESSHFTMAETSSGEVFDVVVANDGPQGVLGVDLFTEFNPTPNSVQWTCFSLNSRSACPKESGSATHIEVDLAAESALLFQFDIAPKENTLFQGLSAKIDAVGAPGVFGITEDSKRFEFPLQAEGVFKNGFE